MSSSNKSQPPPAKPERQDPAGSDERDRVQPPAPPPLSESPPRVLIIGAGSRGRAYARAIRSSSNGVVVAVAEPDHYKRTKFGRNMIWGDAGAPSEGAMFSDWREFIIYEKDRRNRTLAGDALVPAGVDAAFVCVLDEMHREVVVALSELGGLHIMCEKPLATTLADCVSLYRCLRSNRNEAGEQMVFSIGHVLRYSPHNILLRKLVLEDRVIGDLLSVNHTEPVGWWHFTHSYVRGNWRRESTTAPSLLTKSCHDMDVLLWLLCSPPSCSENNKTGRGDSPHLPSTVSSRGSLQYFKKNRKPTAAGAATNCLSCPIEESCKYSAPKIYVGSDLIGLGTGNTGWPVSIVLPDIESYGTRDLAREALLSELAKDYNATTPDTQVAQRNWFGRCVYECDNDVCDEQVVSCYFTLPSCPMRNIWSSDVEEVTITWDDDPLPHQSSLAATESKLPLDPMQGRGAKTAIFHMVAQTRKVCERYTNLYGVDGEIYADSSTITVHDFRTGQTVTHKPHLESLGHGGGDAGLARQFILAVDKVKNHGWTTERAQRELVACTLEEVIRSHAMVFCAEEARKDGTVISWNKWWENEVQDKLREVPL